jgi:RNA polymerase sigma-70 factor (ECF subfamily)
MQRAYYGALGLVGSHADALDLSQEAFVRAFGARSTIDPERPFYTWFYQILRRLCFNQGRDRHNRQRLQDEAQSWLVAEHDIRGSGTPEQNIEREQRQGLTRLAIEGLPDAEREIIVLRELEELSYRQIADLLEIPQGTVMSRLYAARKRLAATLVALK